MQGLLVVVLHEVRFGQCRVSKKYTGIAGVKPNGDFDLFYTLIRPSHVNVCTSERTVSEREIGINSERMLQMGEAFSRPIEQLQENTSVDPDSIFILGVKAHGFSSLSGDFRF